MKNLLLVLLFTAFVLIGCTGKEKETGDNLSSRNSSLGSKPASDSVVSSQEEKPQSAKSNGSSVREKLASLGIGVAKKRIDSVNFELEDLDGNLHKLTSYRGKVVFLNFWATWCPPCREEMPSMERLHKQLKDEGLEIVAVDLQESAEKVKDFMDQYKLTFTALLDKDGQVGRIYGARSIPTTYLIDREGNIFARAVGAKEWDDPKIVSAFRNILQNGFPYDETTAVEEKEVVQTGEVKEFTIEAYNWGFRKSPVKIRVGDKVRIRVKSTQGTHGIVFPDYKVSTGPIRMGNEKVVEFIPTRAGKVLFGCNVPCGLGHMSMRDVIEVTE